MPRIALPSDNKRIPDGVVFINIPPEVAFYLVKQYQHLAERYVKFRTILHLPHFAFAYDFAKYDYTNLQEIVQFMQRQKILVYHFSFDKIESLNITSGYKNIVFYDYVKQRGINRLEQVIDHFRIMGNIFDPEYNNVFYMMPDYIFEPTPLQTKTYKKDDYGNTRLPHYSTQASSLFDHIMQTYKIQKKINLNRIVYPLLYQHEKNLYLKQDIKNVPFSKITTLQYYAENIWKKVPKRSFMSYEEMARCFIKWYIHHEEIPKEDFIMSSPNYAYENDLYSYWSTGNKGKATQRSQLEIRLEENPLWEGCFNTFDEHLEFIKPK